MWVDCHRIEMTITQCPKLLFLVTPIHAYGSIYKTDEALHPMCWKHVLERCGRSYGRKPT